MKRPDLITIRVEGEDMVEIIDTQPILKYISKLKSNREWTEKY